MKSKILLLGFFLIIFLLFETIFFYPKFFYLFIALLGAASIFGFIKTKRHFGFNRHIFLWFLAIFFYLASGAAFVMFVGESLLRHLIAFCVAFLFAFWFERFVSFLSLRVRPLERSRGPEGFPKSNNVIDVFLFQVLALSSFYFGASSVYGAAIFLSAHWLLLLIGFVLLSVVCAILFWDPPCRVVSKENILDTDLVLNNEPKRLKPFLIGLLTVLAAELAFAVYFLPLPIFSMSVSVFLFWVALLLILRDYSLSIFEFRKYGIKIFLFLLFVTVVLFTVQW